jgi:hypothetical protein
VVTNFHWEYVWHCHLLGHEENDMMRPIVFTPTPPSATATPTRLAFGQQVVGRVSTPIGVTVTNTAPLGSQSLAVGATIAGRNAADYAVTNGCAPGAMPAQSCAVQVTVRPGATGSRTATLTLRTNDPANPTFAVSLTATGIAVPTPPAAPANLTVTALTASSVTLRWTDGSNNETAFAVWRSTAGGAFAQVGTVTRTATQATATGGNVSFADATAAAGTSYAYQVTATNLVGASPPSNTVTVAQVVPGAPALNPPTAVAVTATRDRVTLTWTAGTGTATSWTIQRATDAAFTLGLVTSTVNNGAAATWTGNAPRATTLYYRVAGANGLGAGPWSSPASILTP